MAQLRDTLIQGSARVTDTLYSNKINLADATASLSIFTDANKNLITKSAADARTAIGVGASGTHADSYFVKAITSTDNNIPRFNSTAGQLQSSRMSINDNGLISLSYNGQYPGDIQYSNAAGLVGESWLDTGHATNVSSPRFYWRVRRPKSTATTTTESVYEQFRLPAATAGTAASVTYEIITTKNLSNITSVGTITSGTWNGSAVPVANGGTGATTAANARTNLGLGSAAIYNITGGNEGYSSSATLIPRIGTDGVMEVGKYIDFHASTGTSKDYDVRITAATTGLTISGTTSGTFSGSLSGNATNVTGTVAVAHGGTGVTSFTNDCVVVATGTTQTLVSRGLKVTGATDGDITIAPNTSGKSLTLSTSGSSTCNISIASNATLYLGRASGASIVFQQAGTEIARFNQKNNLQLGDVNSTQDTYKFYVNGASGFTGKIAFNTNITTENASIQYINSGLFYRGTILTGTGTAAAGNGTNGYTGALWKFNLGIATPADGDIITIKVPVASHDYGTYISTDNGTTYKPIGILGGTTRLTGQYDVNTILTLAYDADGTINSMFPATGGSTARSNISGGCWRVVNYYDSGFNEWNLRQYTIKAVNAITSGHIIGGTDSGYSNIDSGTAFDIRYAVLYAGSNISASSTGTNNFIHHYAINIKNSSNANITLTTYKNVYIKGTISGHLFTPITGGSPYVSDITAADDGYAYYYIGRCYSSNNAFTFDATGKSIFWYKNGAIRQYSDYGISFVAYGGTLATNGWKALHGRTNGPHISVAYNNASKDWNTSTYSASLTWGGIGDTHGLIDCCYNSPIVSFGGSSTGNGTDNDPKWYFKLIGTSAQSYTFPTTSKTLAATDGSNASGTWGINISGNAANVTGTVTYQHGGTGLTTLGSAGQVLKVNSSANGIEWGTVSTADEKVKVAANITTAADYPVVFANSNKSTTAAETAGLNKSGTKFYFNPSTGLLTATQVANAIWNDYAEYRKQLYTIQPGYVIKDTDSGYVVKANERLIPGAQIVSDTWGHSMGKTDECQTPVAVAGRVLAYTYRPREQYHAGMAVCSAPGGTIDIMTREEIRDYPDAIIGIVSEIPDYEEWGSGKVKVDGRIWIKVR